MNTSTIFALILFVLTYVFMFSMQKIRPYIAVFSALIFVAVGLFGIFPDYSYSFRFEELDEAQVVRDTISTNARDVFNGILKQYGIRGEADGNPSDSYMASWKIGHPESEIKE